MNQICWSCSKELLPGSVYGYFKIYNYETGYHRLIYGSMECRELVMEELVQIFVRYPEIVERTLNE